jgi:hypothetical protein
MTEIEEFILTKSQNTPQTIKNYKTQYKSIRALLNKDIVQSLEKEILAAVKKLSNNNVSSEWTYMNLPFMMRSNKGLTTDLIEKRRDELKILRDEHTFQKKEDKRESLPSMKVIKEYTNESLKNKEYKKYIVNFLIMNYGVRNKDVDCLIVSSNAETKDESKNYLVVKKREVEWKINEYKTLKNYGAKNIIIKSKPFIEAIKTLPINTWLLTGSGEQLNETGLGTTIKRLLYNKLTEGDYMKVILNEINNKKNTTKLLENFSKTRGTNIENLLAYYDTSKIQSIL